MRQETHGWRTQLEEDPAKRPHARVKAQVDGLDRLLRLETRSRVLDLGCGASARAVELARRGHRVLGVDADERALAHARAAVKGERLNVHFLKADSRAISYRAEFDAVVCLDGAFGRFPDEREDLQALEAARRALKPAGKLLLDVINREWLVRRLETDSHERGESADHLSFDLAKGLLHGRRAFAQGGVRVYALTELLAQAKKAGFVSRAAWGGLDAAPYVLDSPRLVALFERGEERVARRADEGLATAIRIKGRR
jgi:SAM-dependent methyltransferase